MKALAQVADYFDNFLSSILNVYVPYTSNREVQPRATYPQFCGACVDMNIQFNRAMYRSYCEAYEENVEKGYDGLRVREFLLLTANV